MTREEQIIKEASEYANDSNNIIEWGDGWEDYNDFDQVFDAFKNGAKWADENPDKRKVYTKDELYKMGFAFDTNGNIVTPDQLNEDLKKYLKYQKRKFIEKAEEWLWNNFYEHPHERWLICSESFDTIEYMIERFKAAMEE